MGMEQDETSSSQQESEDYDAVDAAGADEAAGGDGNRQALLRVTPEEVYTEGSTVLGRRVRVRS